MNANADVLPRRHRISEDMLLLIESADTSLNYGRNIKVPLYARHGIPEVWLVDLAGEIVEVFRRPSPTGYLEVSRHGRRALQSAPGASGGGRSGRTLGRIIRKQGSRSSRMGNACCGCKSTT